MADKQYVPLGAEDAPAGWTLPPGLQIVPKIAYASFDGSGAGSSFLPCLRIVSDSGHVAAECVASTTVAAGGSADVTWFRGVAGQASSTGAASMILASGQTNFGTIPNVPSHGNALVSFDVASSTDTSKLAWLSVSHTHDQLSFLAPAKGSALVIASCIWSAGTKIDCRIGTSGNDAIFHDGFDSFSGYDSLGGFNQGTATLMDVCPLNFNISNGPVDIYVNLSNSDAAASAPDQVTLLCFFFPDVTTA